MYAEYKKLAAYEPQDMHGKTAALRALQRLLAAALVDWVDPRWGCSPPSCGSKVQVVFEQLPCHSETALWQVV